MNYPICLIDPAGGTIKVQLKVNNALLTGAKFATSAELQTWEMQIDENGQAIHEINLRQSLILVASNGKTLKWAINICSDTPAMDTGTAEIILSQDDSNCLLTKPLNLDLKDVPSWKCFKNTKSLIIN